MASKENLAVMQQPLPRKISLPTTDKVKFFCLYNPGMFLNFPVSTETTPEEVQNLALSSNYVPDKKIIPIGYMDKYDFLKSLVSVGSMVYCIGGSKIIKPGLHEPSNEVTKFRACQPKVKLESCCNMIQPRQSPAVVSIRGKIYVFGGLPKDKEDSKECTWAEFLDTNMPESKQKWKPLKEPVFRVLKPFAIHYMAQTILIGNSHDIDQGAIVYNVLDESSLVYNFAKTMSWACVRDPVTVFRKRTMYWIDGFLLRAYELDTHIHYQALMTEVFPDFDVLFRNTLQGPVLVHLKDDLFVMFAMFCDADSYPKRTGIVDCTKFRVTKCELKSGERILQVDRVGYQSYQCDSMWTLCGALPLSDYRCSDTGCSLFGHVGRASHDSKAVITTFEGQHDHTMPSARTVTNNTSGANTNVNPWNGESGSGTE